jgi:superfamily II DNA or RNA helicase
VLTLKYSPVRTYLQGHEVTSKLDSELDDLLSFQTSNYIFSTSYLLNEWDGFQRFYSRKTHSFKSGLIYKVIDFLKAKDIPFEIEGFDDIPRYEQQGNYLLRPHQIRALDALFKYKRGILQSPPRSGKTKIAGAFFDQSRLFPAVFMCNSIDIASQTLKSFEKDIPHVKFGFVGDNQFELGDITIMTVQSAVMAYEIQYKMRRAAAKERKGQAYKKIGSDNLLTNEQRFQLREYIESAKAIIYDEAHHSQSSIATTVISQFKNAKAIIGLSATPNYGRPEDMIIESVVGNVFFKVSYAELIEAGWLLPARIYLYKLPKTVVPSLSYSTIHKYAITDNVFRNTIIARIAAKLNRGNKNVLIVVDKKKHGDAIHALYPDAVRLYGEASLEIRNEVKQAFNSGAIKCVISTLWDEGVDIPGLHYVINAAGGMSPVDIFQRLRSITPNPDDSSKKFGGLIDFIQTDKYIRNHCNFRKELYESEPSFQVVCRDISKWDIHKARASFE